MDIERIERLLTVLIKTRETGNARHVTFRDSSEREEALLALRFKLKPYKLKLKWAKDPEHAFAAIVWCEEREAPEVGHS